MTAVRAHNARRVQALRAVLDLKGKSERERMLALIATLESGRMVDGERPFDAPARRAQQSDRARPKPTMAGPYAGRGNAPINRVEARRAELGRGERIRTFDLLNPIQVRYQTALRPDRGRPV